VDRAWTGVDPDGSSLSGPVTPNFIVKHGNDYVLCILQRLQKNMVFGAKKSCNLWFGAKHTPTPGVMCNFLSFTGPTVKNFYPPVNLCRST
jgi:hypothetical protein